MNEPVQTAATTSDPLAQHQVSAVGVISSEWIKFRSLRSNLTILGATVAAVLTVGSIFSAIVAGVISNPGEAGEFGADPAGASLQGRMIAHLVVGVLGVLVMTSEYAAGTIRTTLTTVPRRVPVLGAKIVVVTAVTFVTMLASTFAVFFIGQAIIGTSNMLTPASLGDPGVLRALFGTAGYLTGIALLGLAIGTLLRSTAASISVLVTVVFLLPGLGNVLLPTAWADRILRYLPSNAGEAFSKVASDADLLSPTAGLLVFTAWVVVPLAAAAIALRRRAA